MKKRILSILLAALMVVPMFLMAMPISAAATKTTPYTYQFEDVDARNIADGQVFDVAAFGEVSTAPNLDDGVYNASEYTISGTFNYCDSTAEAANVPVSFAVKDQYLYAAIKSPVEDNGNPLSVRYELGISNNHKSYKAYDRVKVNVYPADNENGYTLSEGSSFVGAPDTGAYITDASITAEDYPTDYLYKIGTTRTVNPSNCVVDFAYDPETSVYEAKFDLSYYYRFFFLTPEGQDVYEHPIVSFSFWYDIAKEANMQWHYSYKPTQGKIDSLRSVGWVPATIIIPDSSLFAVKNAIGPLGRDHRNAIPGQLATLDDYATTLPAIDGKATESDNYQITHQITAENGYAMSAKIASGTGVTAKYSMGTDGYLYAAFSYELAEGEEAPSRWLTYFGLSGNHSSQHGSRYNVYVNANGLGYYAGSANKPTLAKVPEDLNRTVGQGWTAIDFFNGYGNSINPGTGKLATYEEGEKTYVSCELKISIAVLAAMWKQAGWAPEASNAVHFMMWPDGGTTQLRAYMTQETFTAIGNNAKYGLTEAHPTVKLPDGCVEKFMVENWNELEAYGQKTVNAGPSTAILDGKIGASEYTASFSYTSTELTVADTNISGTNYFAADEDNIYIGAKIYDPNFVLGSHSYQMDIGIVPDGKVDYGQAITRMNWALTLADANTLKDSTAGVIYRAQDGTKTGKPESGAIETAMHNKAKALSVNFGKAGSYDATTKTIVYEVSIPKADLAEIFFGDRNATVDQIYYYDYHYSKAAWHYLQGGKLDSNIRTLLKQLTYADNKDLLYNTETSTWNADNAHYAPGYYASVINFTKDYQTKGGASARLSATSMEKSGLRFQTVYNTAYLDQMKALAEAYGETLEIGTLIAPADYVAAAGEFTHEALAKKYTTSTPYVEVKATLDAPFATGNGTTTYAGSIVNIKDKTRDFAGIGYIKIGDNYFYSESYCVRNVARIATDALADKSATQTDVYKYQLSDGKFSPYAPGQIIILEGLKSN